MVQDKDKNVLELGCNKGFGTVIYAEHASSVKAVDTSSGAIEKARKLNARENIEYICLDSWTLPFADNAFDLVVLFQVIEHIALDKLDIFLREIKRVTRMDGQVFFTTPNRDIRLLPFQMPRNKFHTREYSAQDLGKLLSRYFVEARVEGLFGEEALNEIERRRVRQRPGKGQAKARQSLCHGAIKEICNQTNSAFAAKQRQDRQQWDCTAPREKRAQEGPFAGIG
jgi:SAM-dependent methyltransferase